MVWINGTMQSAVALDLNRGLQYGDGFFETMHILPSGECKHFPLHQSRMRKAAKAYQFDDKQLLEVLSQLPQILDQLLDHHGFRGQACALKIMFWRCGEGLYTPQSRSFDYVVMCRALPDVAQQIPSHQAIFASSVRNVFSKISPYKSLSAASYVLAGIERARENADDIILLDAFGHVSECLSSTIFWVKKDVIYTPKLRTGCVDGIMRRYVLNKKEKFPIRKTLSSKLALMQADHIFSANVNQIAHIVQIGEKYYKPYPKLEALFS